jgi:hypothetical protein
MLLLINQELVAVSHLPFQILFIKIIRLYLEIKN